MIEARNISYEIQGKKILEDVSLELSGGEVLAVLGSNGAEKSTVRKILSGDLQPTRGEVLMNGKLLAEWTLSERAKVRAVLPQDSSLNFPFSVMEVVLMGRAPHLQGSESKKDYEIGRAALNAVDAAHLEERIYPTLSGGERQRVHLARILAQIWEPPETDKNRCLLLDEPISNIDIGHQHQTLKIVRSFAKKDVAVLLILHDLNLAAQYADRILMINAGKIVAQGKPENILTPEIIRRTFQVTVAQQKHPFFDCPLIIWRDDN